MDHMGHFSHTPESTHKVSVNQVSWSRIKTFWKSDQEPLKFPYLPIFVIKDPLKKLEANKSKFYLNIYLGNIVVYIQAKYRIERMKTEEACSIINKLTDGLTDRQMDGRRKAWHRISSADYVSSGAKSVK